MLEAARDRCLQKVLFMHMCRWSYGSLPTFLGRTSVRMFSDTFHFTCDRFFRAKLISSRSPHFVTSVDTGDDRTFMVLSTSFVLWITLHLLPTRCALRRQYLHRKVFDDADSSFHKAFFSNIFPNYVMFRENESSGFIFFHVLSAALSFARAFL